MTYEDFLSLFPGHQPHGANKAMCQCPAHSDGTASLSVMRGDKGIALKCHAGCTTADVVAQLNLRMGDLFYDARYNGYGRTQAAYTGPTDNNGKSKRDGMPPWEMEKQGLFTDRWDYHDEDGKVVCQKLKTADKQWKLRQADHTQYDGWRWGIKDIKPPLFNLPAVLEAIASWDQEPICLAEGEKDALRITKETEYVATTSIEGAPAWPKRYTETLSQASRVLVFVDNDLAGWQRAQNILKSLPNAVIVPQPFTKEHEDISDWFNNGGTKDQLDVLIAQGVEFPVTMDDVKAQIKIFEAKKEAALAAKKAASAVARAEDLCMPNPFDEDAPVPSGKIPTYRPLGVYKRKYFFFVPRSCEVNDYSAAQLSQATNLLELANLEYWQKHYQSENPNSFNKMPAADDLIDDCIKVGKFNPDNVRGRGAWWDEGRVVLHCGDRLIVDGREQDIASFETKFIYIKRESKRIPFREPLPVETSRDLVRLCEMLSWRQNISGAFLAGWIALAPVCGVLAWRPHIWLTGPAGSGKTWTMNHIVNSVREVSLFVSGSSTEAGIRQRLEQDALPVLHDECEATNERSKGNIERELELARQASSSDGNHVLKGSASGQHVSYSVRSAFCFASINPGIVQKSDESRITVLELVNANNPAHFKKIEELGASMFGEQFGSALIARSCKMVPVIRQNIKVLVSAIMNDSRISQRFADQYGTLLAGYWSLLSDTAITVGEAQSLLARLPLDEMLPAEETKDELRCLMHIMEQRVMMETTSGRTERTIGELVMEARYGTVYKTAADQTLRRHGILATHGDGVMIANKHSGIAALLKGTPWDIRWDYQLKRVDGADSAGGTTVRFYGGITSRVTRIPWEHFDDHEWIDRIPAKFPEPVQEPVVDEDEDEAMLF